MCSFAMSIGLRNFKFWMFFSWKQWDWKNQRKIDLENIYCLYHFSKVNRSKILPDQIQMRREKHFDKKKWEAKSTRCKFAYFLAYQLTWLWQKHIKYYHKIWSLIQIINHIKHTIHILRKQIFGLLLTHPPTI